MPPRSRRISRQHRGWTEHHIYQLGHGFDYWGTAFGDNIDVGTNPRKELDLEAAREGWEELGEDVLANWIAEKPGTRPWGWWLFDAPQRLRVVSGVEHPQSGFASWQPDRPRHFWFGRPSPKHAKCTAKYETETEYLTRLNLLTQSERLALGDMTRGSR